ncbi:hypothetical protein ACI6PS_07950 [Flavobacterium sp. PLA-1-15]|uniref:hypothetical protein n=1 Tax=Flavobacterium sp. PLA-1-15 TaxID=3380533 RepID=UPI003B80CBF2
MKNKKNLYVLLPVVLFIWGAVLYQFFSYSDNGEMVSVSSGTFNPKPLSIKPRDTFSIDVDYRDPFLGKIYPSTSNKINKKSTGKRQIKKEESIVWPSIVYKGIVSDSKDKTKVFMLIINGRTFLMKRGDVENDVFLKEGNRESIYVKYKGHLNIILLNG